MDATRTAGAEKPRVLCVDDERAVVEALALNLGRQRYAVSVATSGAEGLDLLGGKGPFAVVLSDMRMPQMDGVAFLSQVRRTSPDTVRILLTGHADLDAAVAAVNDGQVFRFLTKPCPAPLLAQAVEAGVQQARLLAAEKVLLEETLKGSVKALLDVLALTSPAAFGRTQRIREHVMGLALGRVERGRWQVELAAMVSQLGCITLPPETLEKLYHGLALAPDEQAMVARLPSVAERLLAHIPRLEGVRAILAAQSTRASTLLPREAADDAVAVGACVLRLATDYDLLESQGLTTGAALDTLRGRKLYDPGLLQAFAELRGAAVKQAEIRELPLRAIHEGMVLAEDVRTVAGVLLAPRGHEVTAGFVERARNYRAGSVKEPIRVVARNVAS